jgi:hypothetical protein
LSKEELNYTVFDKELLAIIRTFEEFRSWLMGTVHVVTVYSDHKNLQYFASTKELNRRQVRWSQFLEDFNYQIVHRPGSEQVVPDALSRKAQYELLKEDREVNVRKLIPVERFVSLLVNEPDEESSGQEDGSNSDYDINLYESTEDEENSSDDGFSSVGDLAQFDEFEGRTVSDDPTLFQHLLQFMWSGILPMALSPRSIGLIKKQSKFYAFKDDKLYKNVLRNGHLHHAFYVPAEDRKGLIRQYHWTLGHMQKHT